MPISHPLLLLGLLSASAAVRILLRKEKVRGSLGIVAYCILSSLNSLNSLNSLCSLCSLLSTLSSFCKVFRSPRVVKAQQIKGC